MWIVRLSMPLHGHTLQKLKSMGEFNIVLAGVGGQGTILAAEILGAAAVKDCLNVRVSEIHGMAQRGGAVTSNVRIGERVLSSTVLEGQADVLVGFELLETLRSLKFASEKTLIIMSDERISPTELAAQNISYPSMDKILEKIHRFTKKVIIVPTEKLSKQAGSILTRNVILIGVLAATGKIPIKTESLMEALKELVPAKQLEMNIKAFKLGFEYANQKVNQS